MNYIQGLNNLLQDLIPNKEQTTGYTLAKLSNIVPKLVVELSIGLELCKGALARPPCTLHNLCDV